MSNRDETRAREFYNEVAADIGPECRFEMSGENGKLIWSAGLKIEGRGGVVTLTVEQPVRDWLTNSPYWDRDDDPAQWYEWVRGLADKAWDMMRAQLDARRAELERSSRVGEIKLDLDALRRLGDSIERANDGVRKWADTATGITIGTGTSGGDAGRPWW